MSVKIPATRVKKSQQAPPAVSPVTTIFYPGDWNFLRTHLASSFIIFSLSADCNQESELWRLLQNTNWLRIGIIDSFFCKLYTILPQFEIKVKRGYLFNMGG